jgi:hypothetical protein
MQERKVEQQQETEPSLGSAKERADGAKSDKNEVNNAGTRVIRYMPADPLSDLPKWGTRTWRPLEVTFCLVN